MKDRAPSLTLTILKRELLTGLRSWKSFILLLALLAVLYCTTFYAMDAAAENYIFMSSVMQSLFFMQVAAAWVIVFAVVPALAAVGINSERQEENYDLLLTTLITPRRIVLGKFAAVLIRALLIATAALPFTGLVYFYAGVDVQSFFGALAFLVPAALCNTAIGLWCSNLLARPARSIFLTFGIIALMAGLIPVSAGLYYNVSYFRHEEPFVSIAAWIARHPMSAYILYQLTLGALFLLDALYDLRRFLNPFHLFAQVNRAVRAEKTTTSTHAPRVPMLTIPDGGNPLGYKDLCGSALCYTPAAIAAFVLTTTAYSLLVAWIMWEAAEALFTIGILERIALVILVPPMVAVLMVKERDEISFDMLRMSLLRPGDLVAGKIAALLRLMQPVLLAAALCKTLVVMSIVFLIVQPRFATPAYVYVLDWMLLPLHLMFVILASVLGAALPKKLIPAIGGAMGTTLFTLFILLYTQFSILEDAPSNDVEFAMVFLISHLLLVGFAYMVFLGLSMAIVSRLWNTEEATPARPVTPQATATQPPSLPK